MRGRALALAAPAVLAAATPFRVAAAQFSVAQPASYLLSVDAFDARAIWVQPAGLARRREASLGAHLTAGRSSGSTSIREYGITLGSGGAAAAWQHDQRPGDGDGTAWAVGLGLGDARFSAGAARRWYRSAGVTSSTWDVGARFQPTILLDLSLLWRDVGDPVIRDTVQRSVLVPAAALNLLGGRVRAGGEVDLVTRGWGRSEMRAGALATLGQAVSVRARASFSPRFSRRQLSLALEWNGPRGRLTGFTAGATDRDQAGLAGAIVAQPPQRRRRGPR